MLYFEMARIYYGSILIMLALFTLIETGNNPSKLFSFLLKAYLYHILNEPLLQ